MTIDIRQRFSYYLGDTNYEDYVPTMKEADHDIPIYTEQDVQKIKPSYLKDLQRYLNISNRHFWCVCGDQAYTGPNFPLLVKIRDTHNPKSKGIIANLNSSRHWDMCHTAAKQDVPWEKKKNTLVWRGTTTSIDVINPLSPYNRVDFVKDYFYKYNVGFNVISNDSFKKYVKNSLSVGDFLKHKFIAVIDGNDKSSSLNWVLSSGSVPIMPKPRYHSWLCEPWLEPGVHYVEVERDFSDLDKKIGWCLANDEECQKIAVNGIRFMVKNFFPDHNAKLIEKAIMEIVCGIQK